MTSPCTHASPRSPGTAEGTQQCIFYLPDTRTINNVIHSMLFKSRSCATVRRTLSHAGQRHGPVPASPLANEACVLYKHDGLVPRAVHTKPGSYARPQRRCCPVQTRPGVGCGLCGRVICIDVALPP